MNEINWSKAPEGATHYNHTCSDWYKVTRIGVVFFWNGHISEWRTARFWDDRKHDCIQRPTTPSWSGEGLPPVGVVCEAKWGRTGWARCVVFAHKPNANGGTDVLVDVDGDWTFFDKPSMFRPIRTPEQIAADEQETATDVMFARFGGVAGLTRKQCAWVISEGYRKP